MQGDLVDIVMRWNVCTVFCYFFFNDTATTEIYTLSLHDALPICGAHVEAVRPVPDPVRRREHLRHRHPRHLPGTARPRDRKSTRLNSSHANISYAVFCLKKKKKRHQHTSPITPKSHRSRSMTPPT